VTIACNVPLTGGLAQFGVEIQQGVEMLVDEKDLRSKLNFDWEDNASSRQQAVSVLRKQLTEKPAIYISGVKPQYMAIHDEISATRLPHFVWAFDTHLRPDNENNFRTWVNFKVEAPLFINFAKQLKPSRIAIIYVQAPHTDEEYNKVIIPALQQAGGQSLF
jgi:ABC-type branched-subunit amino acid transport system substrate-binding protein